jgi:competence ComEA-like helix-hairpin-helix protein
LLIRQIYIDIAILMYYQSIRNPILNRLIINKILHSWQVLIDGYEKIIAQRFLGTMHCRMAANHNHPTRKEDNMFNFNRKQVAVLVIVLLGLAGGMSAYAADIAGIDINAASAEELAQLKGVGPSHAAGIVAFREKNGPFKKPEDLIQVPGIGQKTFEKNKDLIVVGPPVKRLSQKNGNLPKK